MNSVLKQTGTLLLTGMLALPPALPLHATAVLAKDMQTAEFTKIDDSGVETEVHETGEDPDLSVNWEDVLPIEAVGESTEDAQIVPRKIIGSDDRKAVSRTDVAPYNGIARLTIHFSTGDIYAGTGFFITPDTILTAGHCVFDHENKLGWASSIDAVPGGADPDDPNNHYVSQYLMASPHWISNGSGDTDYDFGLIRLRKPADDSISMLRLRTLDQANLGGTYELPGYPYNRSQQIEEQPMVTASGNLSSMTGRRTVLHQIDTTSGQSGAPILNENDEVVGIHTFAKTSGSYNGGTAIDSYVSSFIASNTDVDKPVYRAYNPNSGEHFYTMNYDELVNIVRAGWKDEGVAWRSQAGGEPVYRLYNPNAGDHHYTLDAEERAALMKFGWQEEGISWYASPDADAPYTVYRLYNPNAQAGSHHFTFNKSERDDLIKFGWKDEGIAFRSR